jgi:hypothetical protein
MVLASRAEPNVSSRTYDKVQGQRFTGRVSFSWKVKKYSQFLRESGNVHPWRWIFNPTPLFDSELGVV